MIMKILKMLFCCIAVCIMGSAFFDLNTKSYFEFCIPVSYFIGLIVNLLDDIYENTKGKK